jgi:hypothetical protein
MATNKSAINIKKIVVLSCFFFGSSAGFTYLSGLDVPIILRSYLLLLPLQCMALVYFVCWPKRLSAKSSKDPSGEASLRDL